MRTLIIVIVLVVIGAISGGAFIYFGLYNVAATKAHSPAVYWVLEKALRASVRQRSDDIVVPALNEPRMLQRGLQLFKAHCVQCHGAPGVAPDAFALGLNPPAANLVHTARTWPTAELFWVIKHGVRTTGMPAWEFRLTEQDIWAVTAFVQTLPRIAPSEYQAMAAQAPLASTSAPVQIPAPIRCVERQRSRSTPVSPVMRYLMSPAPPSLSVPLLRAWRSARSSPACCPTRPRT